MRHNKIVSCTIGAALALVAPLSFGCAPTNNYNMATGVGPTLNVRAFGAIPDDGLEDTAAIQAAFDAVPSTGGTVEIPGGTFLTGNLTITNRNNMTIKGPGKLQLSGNAAPGANIGLQYVGTNTNVTIQDLEILGDGVVGNHHAGVWGESGQTLSVFSVINCKISNVVIGISLNADLSGAINGALVQGNYITDVLGTTSGLGYGIHHANGSGNPSNARIIGNTIRRAHRHSIYQAKGSGVTIAGNVITDNRYGESAASSPIGALAVARSSDVTVTGNTITDCLDGSITVEPMDTADTFDVRNVSIVGNVIKDPIGGRAVVFIGTQLSEGSFLGGVTEDIVFANNAIYQASDAGDSAGTPIDVYSGLRVQVIGNVIHKTGMLATERLIEIRGTGETAGTSDNTDDVMLKDNILVGEGTGGDGIRFDADASTSGIRVDAISNRISVPDDSWAFATSQTDSNIRVLDTPTDGLDLTLARSAVAIPGLVTTGSGFTIDSSLATTEGVLNSLTGGTTSWRWLAAGTERAFAKYDDTAVSFRLDSDGDIILAPNNGGAVTGSTLLSSSGGVKSGGSGVLNALWLFRDAIAGASSNIVQLKIGNSSADQGEFDMRFVNGTNQEGYAVFLPRDTAGTSNFQAGKIGWAKNGGSDTADMDLLTGSARLYQEGGTGHTGVNTNTPNEALDVTGNLQLNTAGNGIKIKTGSNATMGRATLVGGTVTVSTTKATATANIILTTQVPGGTTGAPVVASRVNGTSFTIESRDGAGALQTSDTSTIAWVIFEEAP